MLNVPKYSKCLQKPQNVPKILKSSKCLEKRPNAQTQNVQTIKESVSQYFNLTKREKGVRHTLFFVWVSFLIFAKTTS